MKRFLLFLALVSSLSSFADSSPSKRWPTKTLTEVVEYITNNFSYQCDLEVKSKRKMFFNCTTENAMVFVKVKLRPGTDPFAERIEKATFEFLNSEDGKYSITKAHDVLWSKFSYSCGVDVKITRQGKGKFKHDCNVKELGKLKVETTTNPVVVGGVKNGVEEFIVTFSR
tara:strand:+ start:2345 stop:2854 length:510 start_codon:yes stop_codon:yes gene_type:complete